MEAPTPSTVMTPSTISRPAPSARTASIIAQVSSANSAPLRVVVPSASAAQSSARLVMLLDPGGRTDVEGARVSGVMARTSEVTCTLCRVLLSRCCSGVLEGRRLAGGQDALPVALAVQRGAGRWAHATKRWYLSDVGHLRLVSGCRQP